MSERPPLDSPELAHISPELRALAKPLDEVVRDAANVRVHTEESLRTLRASYTQFSQRKNVVVQVRPTGEKIVRAGNGTIEAIRAMGKKWIAAIFVEEEDVTATAYAIADNRTAELSSWDLPALRTTLDALPEPPPGVTEDWLQEIAAVLDGGQFDPLPPVGEGADGNAGPPRNEASVKVIFENQGARRDGAVAIQALLDANPDWKAKLA